MPTYDYRCTACGHEFELFQPMTAKPERTCPRCAKKALERLIGTGAALLFKGSGFYQTDYRSESYKKAAEAEKPSSGPEVKTAEPKAPETRAADSKPSDSAPAEPKPTAPPSRAGKADTDAPARRPRTSSARPAGRARKR